MLERFELPILVGEPRAGRPSREASSQLRTLAWLRFLLDALDQVERWALVWGGHAPSSDGPNSPSPKASPIPEGWKDLPGDADLLADFFRRSRRPTIDTAPLLRTPTLLDHVFGPLFAGMKGGGGRYFSDRVCRGLRCPDPQRLARLDRLVPGSQGAFDEVPAGVDPWLYDAFDFTNPWYARLFLWRAMDPRFEDPGWDDLAAPRPDGTLVVREGVRTRRHEDYAVLATDAVAFEKAIDTAAAFAVRPDLVGLPAEDVDRAVFELHTAAAEASLEDHSVEHANAVAAQSPAQRWAALSNAIAAHRVAGMLELDTEFTSWWLRGVRVGMVAGSPASERAMYYARANEPSAVDVVLDALITDRPARGARG